MKNLNLNLNSRLTDANNITISSQKALKTYIDSKRILLDFLQDSAPTTFQTGNKWLNTSNLKLYTATSSSNWDSGISITTNELYTFNNVLYHYDGTNLSIYSTDTIKEQNSGNETKIWIGTQSEYDNLDSYDNNTIYNITDNASVISTLLATQQEFNNSAQNKAATPYQVNQALGNYLPLAGGNFNTGAVVRFTNGNGTNSISYDNSNVLNITNNVSVGNNLTANAIVATSGNIYKTNTSGDTVAWSNDLNAYLPLAGGTMTGDIDFAAANNREVGLRLTESGNNLDGGWNWANYDGSGFYLRSASHSNSGEFGFFARNSSGTKKLIGTVGGSLTWADSEVQRAIHKGVANGLATLDSNVKVPTTQLPLATNSTVGVVQGDGTTTSVDASGVISVIGGGGGQSDFYPPLLSYIPSDHILNDIQWLRSDTFSWQSGAVYEGVYNELESEYNNINSTTNFDIIEENYTKVGSPSISAGGVLLIVANSGNYVKTKNAFNFNYVNSWEIITKHKFDSLGSNNDGLMGILGGTKSINYYINPSNKLTLELSSNGSSFDIGSISMLNAITLSEEFYIKAEFTGTAYNLYYGTDLSNMTLQGTISSSTKVYSVTNNFAFGVDYQGVHSYATTYIYLADCSIKMNDNIVWTWVDGITYKKTPRGYEIATPDQEQNIAKIYTQTGISWYYILDTVNERFKLPRNNNIIHGELVKSVRSGNSWYRIYEDGWCEQGDVVPRTANAAQTIVFPIPFKDTSYTLVQNYQAGTSNGNTGENENGYYNKTTTGFTNKSTLATTYINEFSYIATGFIDVPSSQIDQRKKQYKYLYFFVGGYSQEAIVQTAGITSEQLNEKVDVSNMEEIKCVVETYDSGTQWYRLWSDGWCEQGGYVASIGTGSSTSTVTFLKSFIDSNYVLTFGNGYNSGEANFRCTAYTNTTVTFYNNSGTATTYKWYACGYVN